MHAPLHEGWTVRAVGGPTPDSLADIALPATVPGCVHLDLMAAGHLPDPYLDENEAAVAWVGRVDWRYELSFEWVGAQDGDEVDLVALGLDTVAQVDLNGEPVARTQNMHRSYRFPVRDLLRVGTNTLSVTFAAGLTAAEQMSEAQGPRPHVNSHPYNSLRKMACNYGWDWGPDVVTAGIWRPIGLETWRGARIAAVRPLVEVEAGRGLLHAHVDVQRSPGNTEPLTVEVTTGGVTSAVQLDNGDSQALVELVVPDVDLWWPHGYGEQPLYPVEVSLGLVDRQLDTWGGRVGFRTISLDTTPDADGTPFALLVNDVPFFAAGSTGSRTTASCPASPGTGTRRGWCRPATPTST